MTLDELFEKLPGALDADAAAGVDATIQFNSSKPRFIKIANGEAAVEEGTAEDPRIAVTMDDDDLVSMMKGELDGMTAFMTGKLQIDGDIMFAQQLGGLFDASKLA